MRSDKLPHGIEPVPSPQIGRREFWADVQKGLEVAFKPDGATYGFIAFLVVLSSTIWAAVFHFRLHIPNYFWQWDHNILAHGVSSVVFIFIYAIFFWLGWRSLVARQRMLFKVLAWHTYSAWFVFVIFGPLLPLIFDEEAILALLALPFATLILLSTLTYAKGWLIHKRSGMSLNHAIRRKIREQLVKEVRQFDQERRTKYATGVYAVAPVYLIAFLVTMHAAVDAFSFGFQKQTWTVFDGVPGQVVLLILF